MARPKKSLLDLLEEPEPSPDEMWRLEQAIQDGALEPTAAQANRIRYYGQPDLPPEALLPVDRRLQSQHMTPQLSDLLEDPYRHSRASEGGFISRYVSDIGYANDDPNVVFHATRGLFDAFDPDAVGLGTHVGTRPTATDRMYMTRDRQDPHTDERLERMIPLLHNTSKPLRMNDTGAWDNSAVVLREIIEYTPELRVADEAGWWDMLNDAEVFEREYEFPEEWISSPENISLLHEIRSRIEMEGYDSIVYQNKVEGLNALKGTAKKEYEALRKRAMELELEGNDLPLDHPVNQESARLYLAADAIMDDPASKFTTDSRIILDESNLRSPTAEFDPNKRHLAKLTAGVAGAGVLGAAMAPQEAEAGTFKTATDHFTKEAMRAAQKDAKAYKSRSVVVPMRPEDFVTLAQPGYNKDNLDLLREVEQFDEVPTLWTEIGDDGVARVTGHEGRHRSLVLRDRGEEFIPVKIRDRGVRWDQQGGEGFDFVKDWPEYLINQDQSKRTAFPVGRGESGVIADKPAMEFEDYVSPEDAAREAELDRLIKEMEIGSARPDVLAGAMAPQEAEAAKLPPISDISSAREKKGLLDFYQNMREEIRGGVDEQKAAILGARDAGVFDGVEVGTRFRTDKGMRDGSEPWEVVGHRIDKKHGPMLVVERDGGNERSQLMLNVLREKDNIHSFSDGLKPVGSARPDVLAGTALGTGGLLAAMTPDEKYAKEEQLKAGAAETFGRGAARTAQSFIEGIRRNSGILFGDDPVGASQRPPEPPSVAPGPFAEEWGEITQRGVQGVLDYQPPLRDQTIREEIADQATRSLENPDVQAVMSLYDNLSPENKARAGALAGLGLSLWDLMDVATLGAAGIARKGAGEVIEEVYEEAVKQGRLQQLPGTASAEEITSIMDPENLAPEQIQRDPETGGIFEALPDDRLRGAPETVWVPGKGDKAYGIHQQAVDTAKAYAEARGISYVPVQTFAPLDQARATRIADEYEKMEHRPNDPEVRAAYAAMAEETIEQYKWIMENTNLKVDFDYNYEQTRDVIDDVIKNDHMSIFSTRDGYGSNDKFDPAENPLLAETEFTTSDGKPLLVNDIFRIVHDYFGHVKNGVGFRARGEDNAWQAHASMYTPLARRAMTTETRGQNSWVNSGPYGEQNRKASPQDTVYADQKTGLLPIWVSEEGRLSAAARRERFRVLRERGETGFEGAFLDDGRVGLIHYSHEPLERTDPTLWTEGASGRVRSEVNRKGVAPDRTFFGVESQVNPYVRERVGLGDVRNHVTADPELIYDPAKDPENLWERGGTGDVVARNETRIKEAGYTGIVFNSPQFGRIVAMFDPMSVQRHEKWSPTGEHSLIETLMDPEGARDTVKRGGITVRDDRYGRRASEKQEVAAGEKRTPHIEFEKRDLLPAPKGTLDMLEGRPVIFTMADRNKGAGTITGYGGDKLERPIDMHAGEIYGRDPLHGEDSIFALDARGATPLMKLARQLEEDTGQAPALATWRMAPSGGDFATSQGDLFLSLSNQRMTPVQMKALDKAVRELVVTEKGKQVYRGIKDWPGVNNLEEALKAWSGTTGANRIAIMEKVFDTKFRDDVGMSRADARLATTDPAQLHSEEMIINPTISLIDTAAGVTPSSHPAYPLNIHGEPLMDLQGEYSLLDIITPLADKAVPHRAAMQPLSAMMDDNLLDVLMRDIRKPKKKKKKK